jgi:hypothetical protein
MLQINEAKLEFFFLPFFEKGNLWWTRSRLSCSEICSSVIPVVF